MRRKRPGATAKTDGPARFRSPYAEHVQRNAESHQIRYDKSKSPNVIMPNFVKQLTPSTWQYKWCRSNSNTVSKRLELANIRLLRHHRVQDYEQTKATYPTVTRIGNEKDELTHSTNKRAPVQVPPTKFLHSSWPQRWGATARTALYN